MGGNGPRLFGVCNSNRNFSDKKSWGKNKFNSSFPVSLCCYLEHSRKNSVYLKMNNGGLEPSEISIADVFGISSLDKNIYFSFESPFSEYSKYIVGKLPRTDLVVQDSARPRTQKRGLEIKLTAIPDNTTKDFCEGSYGSEIVVRPDTIVYLACSIIESVGDAIKIPNPGIKDWSEGENILPRIDEMTTFLSDLSKEIKEKQSPFLLQPIWKTTKDLSKLADDCLDVFTWSNAGFLYFVTEIAKHDESPKKITRQKRTIIWLYKMLLEWSGNKQIEYKKIIDELSYNTKNDKAFASSGAVTVKYMKCERLLKPCIKKEEIKNIILGGGQRLLSPERRLDAVIFNSPELF